MKIKYTQSRIYIRRVIWWWRLATVRMAIWSSRLMTRMVSPSPLERAGVRLCVVSLLLLGTLSSCSSDDLSIYDDPFEIVLSSGIGAVAADVQETRGDGIITNTLSENLPVSFVRLDCPSLGSYPADYVGKLYLPAKIDRAINRIRFKDRQFYLSDGGDTKFIGWYPEATSTTATDVDKVRWNATTGTVTFPVIDGSTDILVAQPFVGSLDNRFTDDKSRRIKFSHVLTQVKVFIKSGHKNYIPYWGKVTDIEFVNKCQPCVFTLPHPRGMSIADTVSTYFPPEGAVNLKMRAKGGTGPHDDLTLTTEFEYVGYAMFAPHKIEDKDKEDTKLTLKVSAEVGNSVHYIDIPFKQAPLLAGEEYHLYLTFIAIEIEPTVVISKWEEGDAEDQPDEVTVV